MAGEAGKFPRGGHRLADGRGQCWCANSPTLATGWCAGGHQPVRQELGRLTEAGINSYGEDIDRTKGIVLLERHRVKVIVGKRVCPKTGCITPRTAWRTVKVLVASIKTRLGDWSLVPKKHQAQAITQAEQRYMEQPDTPAT